jgi:hypothetical protein
MLPLAEVQAVVMPAIFLPVMGRGRGVVMVMVLLRERSGRQQRGRERGGDQETFHADSPW